MSKLIMLVGLPGSGKSKFSQNFRGYRLSTDDYVEFIAAINGKNYNEVFHESIKEAQEKMQNRMYDALHHKNNIVWDQTNLTKKTRANKLKEIPDAYEKICMFFDTPFQTILERNEKRRLTGRNIPDKVLFQMKDSLEVPTFDEGFDYVYTIKGE